MTNNQQLLTDLAKIKALFQKRTVMAVMGFDDNGQLTQTEVHCGICGDWHDVGRVPYGCQTGDGY